MLVLSRKVGETIVIANDVRVTVVEVCGNRIRLGLEAPVDVKIQRSELAQGSKPDSEVKPPGRMDWVANCFESSDVDVNLSMLERD